MQPSVCRGRHTLHRATANRWIFPALNYPRRLSLRVCVTTIIRNRCGAWRRGHFPALRVVGAKLRRGRRLRRPAVGRHNGPSGTPVPTADHFHPPPKTTLLPIYASLRNNNYPQPTDAAHTTPCHRKPMDSPRPKTTRRRSWRVNVTTIIRNQCRAIRTSPPTDSIGNPRRAGRPRPAAGAVLRAVLKPGPYNTPRSPPSITPAAYLGEFT